MRTTITRTVALLALTLPLAACAQLADERYLATEQCARAALLRDVEAFERQEEAVIDTTLRVWEMSRAGSTRVNDAATLMALRECDSLETRAHTLRQAHAHCAAVYESFDGPTARWPIALHAVGDAFTALRWTMDHHGMAGSCTQTAAGSFVCPTIEYAAFRAGCLDRWGIDGNSAAAFTPPSAARW